MSHARLTQARMFDWIRSCLDTNAPLPTDEAIVDAFDLPSVESARTLLADLADAGKITIRGTGLDRVIALGRKAATFTPAPRATPSVKAAVTDVDRTAARIKEIIARGKTAVAPTKYPEVSGTARKAPSEPVSAGSSRAIGSTSPQKPLADRREGIRAQSAAIQKLETKRLATAPGRGKWPRVGAVASKIDRKQLNIHFPVAAFDMLAARAKSAGKAPGAHARDLMLALLDGEPQPARFHIPARVAAAAIVAGRPVLEFAADLLEMGLFVHRQREKASC